MKYTPGLLLAMLMLPLSSLLAQEAHDNYLFWAYPDTKGKAVLTIDKSNVHHYWDLATGKLLYSYNQEDPANNVKMLVHNIQQESWVARHMKRAFTFKGDSTINTISFDGDLFAQFSNSTDDKQYTAMYYKTRQVVIKRTINGITKLWLLKENTANRAQPSLEPVLSFPDAVGRIRSMRFSPSGKYLYAYDSGCMFDMESRKVVWNDSSWAGRNYRDFLYAFNADETRVSTVNDAGMVVLDVLTGQVVDKIPLPAACKNGKEIYMFP
ncbi:MAG: hypothetical protein EOP54_27375, partial [Sphingobacteriales bacterium]